MSTIVSIFFKPLSIIHTVQFILVIKQCTSFFSSFKMIKTFSTLGNPADCIKPMSPVQESVTANQSGRPDVASVKRRKQKKHKVKR